jgi:hypothetical protein
VDKGESDIYNARVAALSMANGAALAKLLRAHGLGDHADNIESALAAIADIVSVEVGREKLTEAMSWVSDQIWNCGEVPPATASRH